MFSLHIDTARTLARRAEPGAADRARAAGAGPPGDAGRARRRRAAPARAGRARADPARAEDRDGPQRRVAAVAADQAAPARRRPRARSARRRDGGAGAVDEHAARRSRRWSRRAASISISRRNALSRWKYRQVDCFICASEAIRQMLIGDGVPGAATVTVHEGIDLGTSRPRRRPNCTRSCGCRTTRRSSATSPRWCRTRASAT